jgi:hypothetical protein
MKITGPGPGAPAAPTGDAQGVDRAGGKGFADKLDKPATASATAPSEQAATAQLKGKISEIASQLKAGTITPEVAVEKTMAWVTDTHVGNDAPAGLRGKVEAALKDAVESDPVLRDKIAGLS